MKPLIGITASLNYENLKVELREEYCAAVLEGGGIPVILSPNISSRCTTQIAGLLDGIVLSGGSDIDPVHFGEPVFKHTGAISPERDEFEISLALSAINAGTPMLGICRGIQVINVAAGGTLYQDIYYGNPDIKILKHHQDAPRWYGSHPIKITPGTRLEKIIGESYPRVNSFHHQAVKEVAQNFKIAATSPDGVIEAVEWRGTEFIIGVQWHPEAMWQKNRMFLNLFTALVQAASKTND